MRSEETGEETQDEVTQGEELVVATPLVWRQTVSTAWDAVAWGLGHQERVRDPQAGRPVSPPACLRWGPAQLPTSAACGMRPLLRVMPLPFPLPDLPPELTSGSHWLSPGAEGAGLRALAYARLRLVPSPGLEVSLPGPLRAEGAGLPWLVAQVGSSQMSGVHGLRGGWS